MLHCIQVRCRLRRTWLCRCLRRNATIDRASRLGGTSKLRMQRLVAIGFGDADFRCLESVGPLDQDLGSDLDDAVGWYAKVFGGIRGGAGEPNEELLLPSWHI